MSLSNTKEVGSLVNCFKKFFSNIILDYIKSNEKLLTEWNYFSSLLDKDPIDIERIQTYIDVATSAKFNKLQSFDSSDSNKLQLQQPSYNPSSHSKLSSQEKVQQTDYLKNSTKENVEQKTFNQEPTIPNILRKAHSINLNIMGQDLNHQLTPSMNSTAANTTTNLNAQSRQIILGENSKLDINGKNKFELKMEPTQLSAKQKSFLIDKKEDDKTYSNITNNGFISSKHESVKNNIIIPNFERVPLKEINNVQSMNNNLAAANINSKEVSNSGTSISNSNSSNINSNKDNYYQTSNNNANAQVETNSDLMTNQTSNQVTKNSNVINGKQAGYLSPSININLTINSNPNSNSNINLANQSNRSMQKGFDKEKLCKLTANILKIFDQNTENLNQLVQKQSRCSPSSSNHQTFLQHQLSNNIGSTQLPSLQYHQSNMQLQQPSSQQLQLSQQQPLLIQNKLNGKEQNLPIQKDLLNKLRSRPEEQQFLINASNNPNLISNTNTNNASNTTCNNNNNVSASNRIIRRTRTESFPAAPIQQKQDFAFQLYNPVRIIARYN